MKGNRWLMAVVMLMAVLLTTAMAAATQGESADKTLSPYFFVRGQDDGIDRVALKSTVVDAKIAGVIADVTVAQVYKNEGAKPIEAIYIFPASTRAAVYAMKMTIGDRVLQAAIKRRDEARKDYEKAKEEGKSASLLEQQRPNVFQMNVANILPGDVIKIELKYTELIVPTDGVYEFVYPTVVGPRYSNASKADAPASEQWVENPYLHKGEAAASTLDITVKLSSPLPISELTTPSHKTRVTYNGTALADVHLGNDESRGGVADFILKYRLAGKSISSGLMLYDDGADKYFLLMVEPQKEVKINQIPPRQYTFIVDVSGSMFGFPLEISKKLLKDLIGSLRPTDTFNVLLFSGSSSVMAEKAVPATPQNIQQALALIERQKGGGGTELLSALRHALSMLSHDERVSNTVVIATDGYVTVEKEAFDLIRNNLGNTNVFTFGIGTSVNRYLLEGMARAGNGEPFVVSKADQAPVMADKFRKMIDTPALTRISVDFGRMDTKDVEPEHVADVLSNRAIVIFGKYSGQPEGVMTIKGTAGDGPVTQKIDVGKVKPLKANSAIKYLWARDRIARLADYNRLGQDSAIVKEVTDIGLKYSLLTDYTSFVAVDTEVRLKDGKAVTVTQPLPLPEGVSDYAVGASAGRGERARYYKNAAPAALAAPTGAAKAQVNEPATDALKQPEPSSVEIIKLVTTSEINREQVNTAIKTALSALNAAALANRLNGTAVIKITTAPDGKVISTERINGTISGIESLLEVLKRIVFPQSPKGAAITITLSINSGT
ncbi:VIT and vWA domain-containing protein [Candidatus Magnetominusculus dajiuhuensis]|uniref:VIT and vWA domain-containing protein n=1 Tax=Candidatus Magnetominusculus dajiuhuensis TaxID=3137712 RepID=UPI003B43954E